MTKLQLLVPMDGTDFSKTIEPQVRKLFPAQNWKLHLLHVARVPVDPGSAAYQPATVGPDYRLYMYGYELPGADLHPMYDEERLEDFRRSLERDLQYEVEAFESDGYEVTAAVNFGEPAEAIVSYAEEANVDLVAMATHHRKGLDRLIRGSVAQRALARLQIPALLLRVEDDEEATGEARTRGAVPRGARGSVGADPSRREASSGDTAAGDGRRRLRNPGVPADTAGTAERDIGNADAGTTGAGSRVRRSNVHKDDQIVTPADTAPAKLAGMSGRGVLTVVWGDDDEIIEAQGSWFPDDPEADLSPLEEASRFERSVIYDGRSVDAETAGHDDDIGEQVRREVRITSVRRYRDYGGETRNLVSFEPVGELDRTDVPEQYTKAEFYELDLQQVADLTGLEPPRDMDERGEARYRDQAWESYKLDIEHRDEWGTARQNTALPHGE